MSWRDFQRLIDAQNTDITAWMAAIDANPNTPEDALQEALLQLLIDQNITNLTKFSAAIIALVRNANSLLDAAIEWRDDDAGDRVIVTGLDGPDEDFSAAPRDLLAGR